MVLEPHGFEVVSAEGFIQALEKCKAGDYDLLIMGHSIPNADKEALIRETQKHCKAPVLSLQRHDESIPEGATEEVDPTRPDLLLEAVKRLTK
jgi:DNA-binding response OmpR family regulator